MPLIILKKMQFKKQRHLEKKAKKFESSRVFTFHQLKEFILTKVYCCNFIEEIYQRFEYRKDNWWSFSFYLINDDRLERTRGRNRTIKHLKLSISHTKLACCNPFWHGLKQAVLISHTSIGPFN